MWGCSKPGDVETVHVSYLTEKFEDSKGVTRSRKSQDTMTKRNTTSNDLKTLHRKLNIEQYEPHVAK